MEVHYSHDSQTISILITIIGVLPIFAFLYLFLRSFKTLHTQPPLKGIPTYTTFHIFKIILSLSLAIISILYIGLATMDSCYDIMYVWKMALDSLMWVVNCFWIRIEYVKLGFSSPRTKIFFYIVWGCQFTYTFLIDFIRLEYNHVSILILIYWIYIVTLSILSFVSIFCSNHQHRTHSETSQSIKKMSSESKIMSENQDLFFSMEEPQIRKLKEKLMKYSEEVGEKPEKISSSDDLSNKKQRTSSQEENNEFMKFEIQNIEINEAREITRNNTKIIVYRIEYALGNIKIDTSRSFTEFSIFYKEMKKNYKSVIFPCFPPKRPGNENDFTIKERITAFDLLLKFVIKRKLISNVFMHFLKSNELLPIFDKKMLVQNSHIINKVQSFEENASPIKQKSNHSVDPRMNQTSSDKTNIISLGEKIHFPNEKESACLKDSSFGGGHLNLKENFKDNSDDNSNFGNSNPRFTENLKNTVIANYANSSFEDRKKNYSLPMETFNSFHEITNKIKESHAEFVINEIEIEEAVKKCDEVFYIINFINSDKKLLFTLEKTYKDFKNLYEKLKIFANAKGFLLEKLPDKGNIVNFMTKECENRIITHRKFALRVFLKYLLNNEDFKECEDFKNFLKL